MSAPDRPLHALAPGSATAATWLHGAFLAEVTSLDDPDALARVQVRLLAADGVDGQDAPLWARVAASFAGADRGAWWMPDIGDEVLVIFVQGDARHPVIVGGLWNGAAAPPDRFDAGANKRKTVRSRNGIVITMHDEDGREKLTLETPGGQKLTLEDGPARIDIADANGNTVTFEAASLSITASAKVKVSAPQVEVSAGMVKVDAGLSKFSGVVQCDTLISNSVVSSAYTPGAGNIW